MRLSLALILPLLAASAGCSLIFGDDAEKAPSDILLRLPAADMTKAQADAATSCAPYKKGAQLKDVVVMNGVQIAEFACK
ncbi:MAG TPA: hypothetical protein VGV37_14605 [Aliidongia sp.]|uniref:hypothetical protein n=1 Tax=Aliidongia sp. TaxID=1914230 RepID=UPI002DDC9440|nr:hypothetical protein [Aliidongia sp.]HEV2675773.1 hypothetical protein [Aliidongia sp.]